MYWHEPEPMTYDQWQALTTKQIPELNAALPLKFDVEATAHHRIFKVSMTDPTGNQKDEYFSGKDTVELFNQLHTNLMGILWQWMECESLWREEAIAKIEAADWEDRHNQAADYHYMMQSK